MVNKLGVSVTWIGVMLHVKKGTFPTDVMNTRNTHDVVRNKPSKGQHSCIHDALVFVSMRVLWYH